MQIILIAAVAKNNTIGKEGSMPWSEPEDLKHFYKTIQGATVLVGSRTFLSDLKEKPLKGAKETWVLSHNKNFPNVKNFHSVEEVLSQNKEKIFIAGGGSVYSSFMPHATKLIITHLPYEAEGDTTFPNINPKKWKVFKEKTLNHYSKNPISTLSSRGSRSDREISERGHLEMAERSNKKTVIKTYISS